MDKIPAIFGEKSALNKWQQAVRAVLANIQKTGFLPAWLFLLVAGSLSQKQTDMMKIRSWCFQHWTSLQYHILWDINHTAL